jgi:hypothetical protein
MEARFDGNRLIAATCRRGNMEFSPMAARLISQVFFESEPAKQADDVTERSFTYGSGWFCPRDGSALGPQGRTDPKCPTCLRRLPFSIIRQLVELHPHAFERASEERSPGGGRSGFALYGDGTTQVLPGDQVELRVWAHLFKKEQGSVNYVPGISKLNKGMEHGGLTWVGVRLPDGMVVGHLVDLKTKRLRKGVRFLRRGVTDDLPPDQLLEG